MEMRSIAKQLQENSYPGRGIIIGRTSDGSKALPRTLSWEEVKTAETVYL